jgi:predicted dienelactone hydrolase
MAQRVLRAFTLLLAVIVPAFSAARPRPPAQFKVGMASRSFTPKEPYNWRGAKTHALQTTLWYRAAESSNEQPLDIPGFSQMFVGGSVARDASLSASPAKFPVILISHGTGGTALSVAWLGAALAKRGYIVAGVNHPGNNATEPTLSKASPLGGSVPAISARSWISCSRIPRYLGASIRNASARPVSLWAATL